MFFKHWQSFIKSNTSGLWSSFPLDTHPQTTVEEETSQQTEKAPDVHCGGTCTETFVYVIHFRRFVQSEPKLAAASFFWRSFWMIAFDEGTVLHIQREQFKRAVAQTRYRPWTLFFRPREIVRWRPVHWHARVWVEELYCDPPRLIILHRCSGSSFPRIYCGSSSCSTKSFLSACREFFFLKSKSWSPTSHKSTQRFVWWCL